MTPENHIPVGQPQAAEIGRLNSLLLRCEGAYAPRTLSGYRADLNYFRQWCSDRAAEWLPACPATVAGFVDGQVEDYRISTIRRRICAITFAHRMSDLANPTDNAAVRLALRRASRRKAQRPDQVQGLTHAVLGRILETPPATLSDLRDIALVCVGYDTLCRSSEIAGMLVKDLRWGTNGAVSIFIPYSKADVAGNGRVTHLSPATAERLICWLVTARIERGAIFQGLHMRRPSGLPLWTSSIRRIVKRAALRAGVAGLIADGLSGHSMRIGAAQDMMVNGFDMLAIMQAGGWRKPDVVLRYVENAATRRLHERRWAALSDGANAQSLLPAR